MNALSRKNTRSNRKGGMLPMMGGFFENAMNGIASLAPNGAALPPTTGGKRNSRKASRKNRKERKNKDSRKERKNKDSRKERKDRKDSRKERKERKASRKDRK